jgi:hypothetical protein
MYINASHPKKIETIKTSHGHLIHHGVEPEDSGQVDDLGGRGGGQRLFVLLTEINVQLDRFVLESI